MDSDAPPRQPPTRDDCWTEEASATLVDAWGRRYLDLNRGNLRQKDWQEVAEEVNALHGHTKKTRRTDVQCKNRIDTLKKKYKVEKMKIVECEGTRTSSWPFYSRMDFLIGSNSNKPPQSKPNSSVSPSAGTHPPPPMSLPSPPMALPLPYDRGLPPAMATPVVMPQKRPLSSPALDGSSYTLRNYSAMAAAAAAAAAAEDEDGDSDGGEDEASEDGDAAPVEESWLQGMRKVAEAIEKFGEIFERVEKKKQKLILDLEKQRMLFVQDLEVQRMQWFTDTLAQQQKKKQAKRSGSSDDAYQ